MPRRLRDYGVVDWLRLRPWSHGCKQAGRMAPDATSSPWPQCGSRD